MKSRPLESTILIGIALLIAVVFVSLAQTADHPAAAAGIGLQTLAGLFAAVQLWANNASNALLRWAANQIDSNRWRVGAVLAGPASTSLRLAPQYRASPPSVCNDSTSALTVVGRFMIGAASIIAVSRSGCCRFGSPHWVRLKYSVRC